MDKIGENGKIGKIGKISDFCNPYETQILVQRGVTIALIGKTGKNGGYREGECGGGVKGRKKY